MSVIYEVNLQVEPEVADDYLRWLKAHIDEMLELPSFDRAQLYSDEDDNWVVQYHAPSLEAVQDYLSTYASKMRGDGLARFEGKFRATRRILRPLG